MQVAVSTSTSVASPFHCFACQCSEAGAAFKVPDHEYNLEFVATYVECKACGTLSQTPMPTFEQLADFYPPSYHSFHNKNLIVRAKNELRLSRLRKLLGGSTGVVLDYGCGDGSFLIEALKRFTKQTSADAVDHTDHPVGNSGKVQGKAWILRVLAVQAILGASLLLTSLAAGFSFWLALFQSVIIYGFVYLYGLMSVTIFAAALRAIAEHQVYGTPDRAGYAALRNFKCNWITRFLMGAYGFGEHETHHLHPGIPYYHLPRLTEELAHEQPSLVAKHGYFGGLAQAIFGPQQGPHEDLTSSKAAANSGPRF